MPEGLQLVRPLSPEAEPGRGQPAATAARRSPSQPGHSQCGWKRLWPCLSLPWPAAGETLDPLCTSHGSPKKGVFFIVIH